MTVGAVVDLDLPTRDAHLLAAGRQIRGWSTWPDEVIPAMLAALVGDAKFCDAHGVVSGNVEVDAFARCGSLKKRCRCGRRGAYE